MDSICSINSCDSVTDRIKLFLLKVWATLLITVLIVIAGRFVATAQGNDVVTNKTVIQLCKAGIGAPVIIAKIKNSFCNFDLSTDGLVALKKGGVSDEIVAEMIAKGSVPAMPAAQNNMPAAQNNTAAQNGNPEFSLQPGVYYFNPATNNYTMINPGVLADKEVAETATYKMRAMLNGKIKAALSGLQANQKINDPNPLFVIVMDMGGQNANSQTVPNLGDPSQVLLVRLKQLRNDRELVIGRASTSGYVQGVEETAKVDLNIKKVQEGFYEVSAKAPLTTGEYSIVYALPDVNGQTIAYESYDFSLKGSNNPTVGRLTRDPRADHPPPPNPLDLFRKKAKKDTANNNSGN